MTATDQSELDGFRAHLDVAGVYFTASNGARFRALIEDLPMLTEPFETARQKQPIYATVTAVASDLSNPRGITSLTEDGGRVLRVVGVRDGQSKVFNVWTVEVQR